MIKTKQLKISAQIVSPMIDMIDQSQSLICQSSRGLAKIASIAAPIANILLGLVWIFSYTSDIKNKKLTPNEAGAQLAVGIAVTLSNALALIFVLSGFAVTAASIIGITTCFLAACVSFYKYQKIKNGIQDENNPIVQQIHTCIASLNLTKLTSNQQKLFHHLIQMSTLQKESITSVIDKNLELEKESPDKQCLKEFIEANAGKLEELQSLIKQYEHETNRYKAYMTESVYQSLIATSGILLVTGMLISPIPTIALTLVLVITLAIHNKLKNYTPAEEKTVIKKVIPPQKCQPISPPTPGKKTPQTLGPPSTSNDPQPTHKGP